MFMTVEIEQKEKNVKITLTIPKELDELVDLYARKSFIRRTQWIVQAITEKIGKEKDEKEIE